MAFSCRVGCLVALGVVLSGCPEKKDEDPYAGCAETPMLQVTYWLSSNFSPSRRAITLELTTRPDSPPVRVLFDPEGEPHDAPVLASFTSSEPEVFEVIPNEVVVPANGERVSVTLQLLGEGPLSEEAQRRLRVWLIPVDSAEYRCNSPGVINLQYGISCGDDVVDPPEECDTRLDFNFCQYGEASCRVCNKCRLIDGTPLTCGDGRIDGPEQCELGDVRACALEYGTFFTGDMTCSGTCQWDRSGCVDTRPVPLPRSEEVGCLLEDDAGLSCFGVSETGFAVPPAGAFSSFSLGTRHGCALDAQGRVRCWGDSSHGQLDAPDASFTQVASGAGFSCGLLASGAVQCWGASDAGVFPPPAGPFVSLAAGANHACGLNAAGEATCWGNRAAGQTNVPSNERFATLGAGALATCGLGLDGGVSCWGQPPRTSPTEPRVWLPPQWRYRDLQLGRDMLCAQRTDGYPVCLGPNQPAVMPPPMVEEQPMRLFRSGCYQAAAGYVACGPNVFPPFDGGYVDATASGFSACAVRADGRALCQGTVDAGTRGYLRLPEPGRGGCAIDDLGLLLDCDVTYQVPPPMFTDVARAPSVSFSQVSRENNYACARRPQGTLVCWGKPGTPFIAPPAGTFIDVATAWDRACAVTATGEMRCWGTFEGGAVSWPGTWRAIESDGVAMCALSTDGRVQCDDRCKAPDCTPPSGTDFVELSMDWQSGCARASSGQVTCFKESYGEPVTPVRRLVVNGTGFAAVEGLDGRWRSLTGALKLGFSESGELFSTATVRDLSSGDGALCARATAGDFACFGQRSNFTWSPSALEGYLPTSPWGVGQGELCWVASNQSMKCTSNRAPPSGLFTAVELRDQSPCGLLVGGGTTCWGELMNAWGPRRLPLPGDALAVGPTANCARDPSSLVWTCGGDDRFGLLPAPSMPFTSVALSEDGRAACGLRSGLASCWGVGASDFRPPFDLYQSLALGIAHGCGVTTRGQARCWGREWAPPPPEPVRDVRVGSDFSCGIRVADGRLVCWGRSVNVNVRRP